MWKKLYNVGEETENREGEIGAFLNKTMELIWTRKSVLIDFKHFYILTVSFARVYFLVVWLCLPGETLLQIVARSIARQMF